MNTKKQADEATTEPSNEPTEGSKRLKLSISRMKKLRSAVKGGGTGDRSWMAEAEQN